MQKVISYRIEVGFVRHDGISWSPLREFGPNTLEEARERRAVMLERGEWGHVRIVQTTVEVVE